MSKKLKIIFAIFFVVLLLVAAFLYVTRNQGAKNSTPSEQNNSSSQAQTNNLPSNNNSAQSQPSGFSIPDKNATTMTITTPDGTVQTNNLYRDPVENLPQNGVVFNQNPTYIASFFSQDEGFLITLLDPDLEKARATAESDFLKKLNITKDQACKLKIELNVPAFVSQSAAGTNYGLSFCPNGKPLPKQ